MVKTRKKQNPFMKFMQGFRKANKGKYDFKEMGREGGKEWNARKTKGGDNGDQCNMDGSQVQGDGLKNADGECVPKQNIGGRKRRRGRNPLAYSEYNAPKTGGRKTKKRHH